MVTRQKSTDEQQKQGLSTYYDKRWVLYERSTLSLLSFVSHKREAAVCLAAQSTVLGIQTPLSDHYRTGKRFDFHRPNRGYGPFLPTFKPSRLVEKAKIHFGGQLSSFTGTGHE